MIKRISAFLGVVLLLSAMTSLAYGQATLSSTTLSSAVTSKSASTVAVASATGITAGSTLLYIDRESLDVLSVSGTIITVRRGAKGTRSSLHTSGATVFLGPPKYFTANDQYGACTATDEVVLQRINVINGRRFNCKNGEWEIEQQDEVPVSYTMLANGSLADQSFFVANQPYQVISCREVHSVAGNDASAVNLQVVKDTSTNAPGAGTDLLSDNSNAGFNLKGTANTVQAGTLITTLATLRLAPGDRLSVDFAGTLTTLAGVTVTCNLKRF